MAHWLSWHTGLLLAYVVIMRANMKPASMILRATDFGLLAFYLLARQMHENEPILSRPLVVIQPNRPLTSVANSANVSPFSRSTTSSRLGCINTARLFLATSAIIFREPARTK